MYQLNKVKYKHILDIENLHIPGQQITCILGESGSGKTTLLRLLNKLISCDKGEIRYMGESMKAINAIELRRKVVMLPQSPAIFTGTIRDNLLIGLNFSEKPSVSDDKLLEILDLSHLSRGRAQRPSPTIFLDEDAEKLSGGEKQRLALGRVILMEPDAFLLDEPSSSLDEDTEETIINNLVHLTKEKNKTLIMVTHSRKIANQFADNIIELKDGKIIDK